VLLVVAVVDTGALRFLDGAFVCLRVRFAVTRAGFTPVFRFVGTVATTDVGTATTVVARMVPRCVRVQARAGVKPLKKKKSVKRVGQIYRHDAGAMVWLTKRLTLLSTLLSTHTGQPPTSSV